MSFACPTCAFTFGPEDRYCRGCYTVFDSRKVRQENHVGPLYRPRWTILIIFGLIGGAIWIGNQDTSRWASGEKGGIQAAAAGLKEAVLNLFAPDVSSSSGLEATERASSAFGQNRFSLSGILGGKEAALDPALALTESRWTIQAPGVNPCPEPIGCEAVMRLESGTSILVRLRPDNAAALWISALDESGARQLSGHDEGVILRTYQSVEPIEVAVVRTGN